MPPSQTNRHYLITGIVHSIQSIKMDSMPCSINERTSPQRLILKQAGASGYEGSTDVLDFGAQTSSRAPIFQCTSMAAACYRTQCKLWGASHQLALTAAMSKPVLPDAYTELNCQIKLRAWPEWDPMHGAPHGNPKSCTSTSFVLSPLLCELRPPCFRLLKASHHASFLEPLSKLLGRQSVVCGGHGSSDEKSINVQRHCMGQTSYSTKRWT